MQRVRPSSRSTFTRRSPAPASLERAVLGRVQLEQIEIVARPQRLLREPRRARIALQRAAAVVALREREPARDGAGASLAVQSLPTPPSYSRFFCAAAARSS